MKIEPQIHITPERIEAIKSAHLLADVVPKYTEWDKRTRKWLCPIHNEKSGSFNITPDGGGFVCYGCGAKGDVIEFIQHVEGLSFNEAFEFLNDGSEPTVPITSGQDRKAEADAEAKRKRAEAIAIWKIISRSSAAAAINPLRARPAAVLRRTPTGKAPAAVNHRATPARRPARRRQPKRRLARRRPPVRIFHFE